MNNRFLLLIGGLFVLAGLQAQNLRPAANEKGKFGYVDEQGKKVISYKYAEAYPFEEGLAKVRKGNKYGFIDPEGDEVGKIKYTLILPFTGSYCRVAVGGSYKDGILTGAKWGFLNKRGEEILKPEYDEIGEFENGFTYLMKGKKYGVINERAEFLLEPKYVAVGTFDEFGHCWFAASGKVNKKTGKLSGAKYGVINKEGKVVVPAKYTTIGYFYKYKLKNGLAAGEFDAATSRMFNSYSLEKPLSRLYNPENFFSGLLSTAKTPEKADSLKQTFKQYEVSTDGGYFIYGKGSTGSSSLLGALTAVAVVNPSSIGMVKYGVMDNYGKIVVSEKKFDEIYCPSDGIARVAKLRKKKLQYGYYNVQSGFLKTFTDKEQLHSYIDGVGKILNRNDSTVYFVDKSGNQIADVFRSAMDFDNGVCIVQSNTNGKYGIIDNKGTSILPLEYDSMHAGFRDDLLGVCKSERWGAVDRTGSVVIPMDYIAISDFSYGWAVARNTAGKCGMITKRNTPVIAFEWDNMLTVSESEPNLVWGKKDNAWYCYDREKQGLAFREGYEDVANFENAFAYVAQGGKYGMIDVKGNVIVPCRLDTHLRLKGALAYMEKLGKRALNDRDAYRLNIYEDETVNSFRITDLIPDEKWDY